MYKYPFVKQEGLKDCGVSCLLMIVRYYKGNLSIERLRDLTRTNKNGTSAYNLVNASNQIGFDAHGIKCELSDFNNIVLPCICHVVMDNSYKHFVVVYEVNFEKGYLVVADPALCIKKISFDDFNKIWSGVVITMYPVASIPYNKDVRISEFIFKNIVKYKSELIILSLLSFIIICLKVFSSFYFKFIIDGINVSKNYLKSLFFVFLLLSGTKNIINYLRNRFLIILNSKLDFSLTLDAFRRIISLPYSYYHNRTSGEIISKINDLGNSRDVISKICVCLFIDLPIVIISSIFLIKMSFPLFLITFIIFVLYLFLSFIYNKIYTKYIYDIKNKKEQINSFMFESINGFETVKGINIEGKIIDKFNRKYTSLLNKIYLLQGHINTQGILKDLVNDIGNILIIFIGSLLVFDNKFDIGSLVTYTSMVVYFLEPIRNIIDLDFSFKESRESISRVISLYENYSDKGVLNFKNGLIEIKNLSFTFDDKKDVLSNINLVINKGDKILFYGASGSGKSTLLKLLMHYYNVPRGCIFISGNDINDYRTSSLRKNISYVSQNEILFNDSLINNLKFYGNDVVSISKCFKFNEIMDNDLGFNMMIEENGFNLSGGQRQRVVLARTFMKQAPIILIDEGLSQIDDSLEREILTNVFDKYDSTIIIVSHRLSNTDLYDRVIHFVDGEIVDETV